MIYSIRRCVSAIFLFILRIPINSLFVVYQTIVDSVADQQGGKHLDLSGISFAGQSKVGHSCICVLSIYISNNITLQ